MGDANAANFRYLNHFFETNQAQSTDELRRDPRRNQGIPWVNTIAADSRGRAYYADISVVPNVPDSKAVLCNTPLGVATSAAAAAARPERRPLRSASGTTTPTRSQEGIFGPVEPPVRTSVTTTPAT